MTIAISPLSGIAPVSSGSGGQAAVLQHQIAALARKLAEAQKNPASQAATAVVQALAQQIQMLQAQIAQIQQGQQPGQQRARLRTAPDGGSAAARPPRHTADAAVDSAVGGAVGGAVDTYA